MYYLFNLIDLLQKLILKWGALQQKKQTKKQEKID